MRDRPIIAVLVALTALRVAVYSLAFPFFNNVDEQAHADLVIKIARGYWPERPWEPYSAESIRLFTRYSSPEYLASAETRWDERSLKRVWDLPPAVAASVERQQRARWSRLPNHEAHTPPIYYSLAAIGYRAAGWVGLDGIKRLYAARLINVPLVALFVWLAYRFCRRWYPERPEIRLGVPLLLTFLPQDLFYSLNTDVLSPLAYTASLMLLLEWHQARSPSARLGVTLGLMVGLTFLVRYTNCVLFVLAGILGLSKLRAMWREGRRATALRATSIVVLCATIPVAIAFVRNAIFLGEFTGTRAKLEMQGSGWTVNTLDDVLSHPIFTLQGVSTFWQSLIPTLWRGEIVWYGQSLSQAAMDGFYSLSTAALWLVATAAWMMAWRSARRGGSAPAGAPARPGSVHVVIWVSPLLAILVLVGLSLSWDFGDFFFPSSDHPYFSQGRLIAGQLVPLLILYVEGIAALLRRLSATTATLVIVALIAGAMLVSEAIATAPVFSSPWNWFHLE